MKKIHNETVLVLHSCLAVSNQLKLTTFFFVGGLYAIQSGMILIQAT